MKVPNIIVRDEESYQDEGVDSIDAGEVTNGVAFQMDDMRESLDVALYSVTDEAEQPVAESAPLKHARSAEDSLERPGIDEDEDEGVVKDENLDEMFSHFTDDLQRQITESTNQVVREFRHFGRELDRLDEMLDEILLQVGMHPSGISRDNIRK